jgi:hypothetical protein
MLTKFYSCKKWVLHDTQHDTLKSIYQALGVPMEKMSYHVVDFLAQGSGALF